MRRQMADSFARHPIGQRTTYEAAEENMAIFGNPQECIDRIAAVQHRARLDSLICSFNPGGTVLHEQVKVAMQRFAEEVLPSVRACSVLAADTPRNRPAHEDDRSRLACSRMERLAAFQEIETTVSEELNPGLHRTEIPGGRVGELRPEAVPRAGPPAVTIGPVAARQDRGAGSG